MYLARVGADDLTHLALGESPHVLPDHLLLRVFAAEVAGVLVRRVLLCHLHVLSDYVFVGESMRVSLEAGVPKELSEASITPAHSIECLQAKGL